MAALTLKAVTRRFGEVAAVDAVSLTAAPGQFIALLGPSGCGKTTLLRLIAGFDAPDAGEIRLGETLLAGPGALVPPEKREMAMVFQSYALWPHMSAAGNVAYPLKLRGFDAAARRRAAGEALERVGLSEMGDRGVDALSGGQRQRVALARALVTRPRVVLFDEPLANLDRQLRAAMERAFRDFNADTGAIMIYVTHDQAEAMALADRIAVLDGGRIAQIDTPEALYARPASVRVAGLIGEGALLRLNAEAGALEDVTPAFDGPPRRAVLIRPEHVALSDHGVAATVRHCAYRGERYVLTLETARGRLIAFSPARASAGDRLHLQIRRGWGLPDG